VLVGSSFGGLGARAFRQAFPDEVVGLVLVDAAEEAKYFPTMARMRAFHEGELRNEARRAERGELSGELAERLRRTRAFSDAEKAAMIALFSGPGHHLASLEELSAVDRTPPAMRAAGGFGGLGGRPLIVLSHGRPYTGDMSVWEQGFAGSQARLAALSSNSARIVAAGVGHSIGLERPDLVAAAIAAVIGAASGAPLDVREVERLARRERPG
jgi:pimeloyl-ACP methyl ester carboxylesterase